MNATRVKPEATELLTLHVVRRERLSPHFARVTLGDGDAERFRPMGFDQWFRLFIPVSGGTLDQVPRKLDMVSYLRFLTTARTTRPVLRNFTVRAWRGDGDSGPEVDVDIALHGDGDTAGPATTWAQTCEKGDPVALLDEGITFNPPPGATGVLLVADESGLPAVAGILASLPADAAGRAVVEIPSDDDRQDLEAPAGVEVTWVVRADPHAVPGRAALDAVRAAQPPADGTHCWVAGEQALATGARRHWIGCGVPKDRVTFCGYWRAG
ncbi:NADPH-dependent ferric siderophore reductase [Pseudonocardia sp. CNS-139]|nr:NADPH-dependent ferric siderophore reductase [Pseudonocardia sp. CNS-139]